MDRQCSVRTRFTTFRRINFPVLASLLAISLMTTLAAGVAHAVKDFGGGSQQFTCDVNSRICKCEGNRDGADCQAMQVNCRDSDGLTILECETTGFDCRCCMGGGKECFGGASTQQESGSAADQCGGAARPNRPPAGKVEPATPAARSGFVWVKGEYACKNGEWSWVSAHWQRARRPAAPSVNR
jgi:hypothetical protein